MCKRTPHGLQRRFWPIFSIVLTTGHVYCSNHQLYTSSSQDNYSLSFLFLFLSYFHCSFSSFSSRLYNLYFFFSLFLFSNVYLYIQNCCVWVQCLTVLPCPPISQDWVSQNFARSISVESSLHETPRNEAVSTIQSKVNTESLDGMSVFPFWGGKGP